MNPESGTITYQYDDNGNLTQKTDARGISITYAYDALNRNTTVDYSNTTSINPDITRVYDTATNGKNRLRESYKGGTDTTGANDEHTKIVSYDTLGRPLDQRQRFKTNSVWSAEFRVQREYNLAGNVALQTYPSGNTVNYGYDNAGRLSSFTGNIGDGFSRSYSTEMVYSPLGGMTKEKFGTDTLLYNKSFYNSRGQLSEIRVGTTYTGPSDTSWNRGAIINHYSDQCWGMCSGQGMSDNNGNLRKQEVYIPLNDQVPTTSYTMWWQRYEYDSLNRLERVKEYNSGSTQLWQQEFVYDRWGNRTLSAGGTWLGNAQAPPSELINEKQFETAAFASTNRLYAPGDLALPDEQRQMRYDAAGNLTKDTYTNPGGGGREYDGENRMTKAWSNNQWQEYTYDADGHRVRRKIDGVETRQIYGMDGELLAEYSATGAPSSPQKEYRYRNGQLLITTSPGAEGLVGYWKFDENSGTTAADSSGTANTGTLTPGTTWGSGQSGSATSLDGVNDYVQVGAQSSLAMSSATSISAWIYPTGAGSSPTNGGILVNREGEYEIARFPNGTIQWAFANTNPGWAWIDTGYVAPLNQWNHIAVTYDNGVVKTYANGSLVHTYNGSGTIGDTDGSQNDFRVGGRQCCSQHFQGRIDEVRVYNRAVTASEVTGMMGAPVAGLGGYWKFDENSGTTAADSSGAGNNGTLMSGAAWTAGQSGSAVSLDGVDDYVKIKDGKISTSTTGTISAWVKLNALVNAVKIMGYGGAAAANVQGLFALEIRQNGSNYYFSVISVPNDGSSPNSAHGSTAVQTGVWYHVTLTSNGSSWQLYVNGVAEAMTNQLGSGNTGRWFGNTTVASPDKTYIGATRFNGTDAGFFNGVIDEVRIYDRALSSSEVGGLASSSSTPVQVNWLVADQLGTPRMIFDKTGSLATMKRHDYLPFGEELFANVGGRTTGLGYTGDTIRQQFTQYERDLETGLDYAKARYYSNAQGRFTGIDPLFESAKLVRPQSWNRYSYALNDPLQYLDPTGTVWVKDSSNNPIWIPDDQWKAASQATDGNGNRVFTILTADEMEYDSVTGQRVRLDPMGPNENNPKGWSFIGPNQGSGAGAMLGTALVASQVDSPAPGPGDIAMVGLAITAFYLYLTHENRQLPVIFNEDNSSNTGPSTPDPSSDAPTDGNFADRPAKIAAALGVSVEAVNDCDSPS